MNPFLTGYCHEDDLRAAGFKSIGRDVQIARNCTIVGPENIEIGDHVRIDSFCTLIVPPGGWLRLGSHIHIGGYCHLSAGDGIRMEDFSGLSQRVSVYSRTDDYSGRHLTNPTVPARYTGATGGPVTLGRHVIIGSGSVILPDLTIGEGSSVGALSLVTKTLAPWGVYFGSPARRLKARSQRLLELEEQLRREHPEL